MKAKIIILILSLVCVAQSYLLLPKDGWKLKESGSLAQVWKGKTPLVVIKQDSWGHSFFICGKDIKPVVYCEINLLEPSKSSVRTISEGVKIKQNYQIDFETGEIKPKN
jgi:hypothetical protein